MLKQSVRILVENAAKYKPEGGIIYQLRREPERRLIVVQDNGVAYRRGLEHILKGFTQRQARNSSTGGRDWACDCKWMSAA
jgi:signal transduction histidine kinase